MPLPLPPAPPQHHPMPFPAQISQLQEPIVINVPNPGGAADFPPFPSASSGSLGLSSSSFDAHHPHHHPPAPFPPPDGRPFLPADAAMMTPFHPEEQQQPPLPPPAAPAMMVPISIQQQPFPMAPQLHPPPPQPPHLPLQPQPQITNKIPAFAAPLQQRLPPRPPLQQPTFVDAAGHPIAPPTSAPTFMFSTAVDPQPPPPPPPHLPMMPGVVTSAANVAVIAAGPTPMVCGNEPVMMPQFHSGPDQPRIPM